MWRPRGHFFWSTVREWAITVVLDRARGRVWQVGERPEDALRAARLHWMRTDSLYLEAEVELETDRHGRPRSRPGPKDLPAEEPADPQLGLW
jgi:hypothetical protein